MSNSRRVRRAVQHARNQRAVESHIMWAPQNKQEFSRMLMPTYCKHKRVEQHTNECLNRPEPRYDHAAVYDRNGNVIGWYDEYDDFSRADTLTSSDGVWALTSPTKRGSTRP